MLLSDGILAIIAIVVFCIISYLEKDNLEEWQKSIQGKPLSWTDRGRKINHR